MSCRYLYFSYSSASGAKKQFIDIGAHICERLSCRGSYPLPVLISIGCDVCNFDILSSVCFLFQLRLLPFAIIYLIAFWISVTPVSFTSAMAGVLIPKAVASDVNVAELLQVPVTLLGKMNVLFVTSEAAHA